MKPQDLRDYVQVLKRYRQRYEPDWYRAFHAYENNTFVAWNRAQQTIVKLPYRKRFFTNLPETKKQADGFENLLLMFMPMFVVYPENISDEPAREEAKALSKLLKSLYLDWDANNIIHKYVHNAIKYPVAFWEIGLQNRWDPAQNKLVKTIVPTISDAFDWLFDPRYEFEENRVIIKVLRKTRKEIKEYKLYKEPSEGSVATANDFKEMIFVDKYGIRQETKDMETVIAYQAMEKQPDGILMQIIDEDGNLLKKEFYKGAEFYPVVPLQLFSGDPYQPSFVQNIIPINRSISLTANRIDDFIQKFVRGAFLTRQGSEVTFTDENGSIVEYVGEKPDVMEMPQLPASITNWLGQLFALSERYGVNSIALGGTAQGSQNRAAKMMEFAVENQRNQQRTPLDNLMRSFKRIAEITIYYLSEYTDEPQAFSFAKEGGDFDGAKFIGQKYAKQYSADTGIIPIPPRVKRLQVDIEDASTATMAAKRQTLLEVGKEFQQLPEPFKRVLLDLLKVGNTSDIMEDLEKGQTLLDSPEFQNLIAQARAGQLPPDAQNGLAALLRFLGGQAPVPNPDEQGVPPMKMMGTGQMQGEMMQESGGRQKMMVK